VFVSFQNSIHLKKVDIFTMENFYENTKKLANTESMFVVGRTNKAN